MSDRRSPVTQKEINQLNILSPNGWFQCPECGAISIIRLTGVSTCINEFNSCGIPKPYCKGIRK